MKKIFIVGCPRSGTTLVQKLLGVRKDTYTLKETHYFEKIRRMGRGKKGIFIRPFDHLILSQQNVINAYSLIKSQNELLEQHDPSGVTSLRSAVLFFDQMMTTEAQIRGKSVWVEKTPIHLLSIRLIKRYIFSAQFIHVIRDGRDVVASLADAADRFPEVWGQHKNLKTAVDLYNRQLQESLKYCGMEDHIFVQYEHILGNSGDVCRKLYKSLGLNDRLESENLNSDLDQLHRRVVRNGEHWKNDYGSEVADTRLLKFNQIFDDKQREFISSKVKVLPSELREIII